MADHSGHRDRLRRKFRLNVLEEHELLEMMLFGVIPRKNTNEIAHELIDRFGGLWGVLQANEEDLCKVNGVGKNTALYIKGMERCVEICIEQRKEAMKKLDRLSQMQGYLKGLFAQESDEHVYILIFSNSKKLISCNLLGKGSSAVANISVRKVVDLVLAHNAASAVIAHNHPDGNPEPSKEDILITEKIKDTLEAVNVKLFDHVVVCGGMVSSIMHPDSERVYLK